MKTLTEIKEEIALENLCPTWKTLEETFDPIAVQQLEREAISEFLNS